MKPKRLLNVISPMICASCQPSCNHIDRSTHVECKELDPIPHINHIIPPLLHSIHKQFHGIVDIWLQILERLHRICTTNQSALATVDLLVSLSEEVKFPMALPDRVPVAFAEFGASSVDSFDGAEVCYGDLVGTGAD
jgi:hypothetical protein